MVDFVGLLEQQSSEDGGSAIAGNEQFLDHVHPTIASHGALAAAIVEVMSDRGLVRTTDLWGAAAVAEVASTIETRVDRAMHARALANLALTLEWAGKHEESRRLALQALWSGLEDPTSMLIAARHYGLEGQTATARLLYQKALRADSRIPQSHYQYSLLLTQLRELEAAAAHFFITTVLDPRSDKAYWRLGLMMAERGQYSDALSLLQQARNLNPARPELEFTIARVQRLQGIETATPGLPRPVVKIYPSGALRTIVQSRPNAAGLEVPQGISTNWYEIGEPARFADNANGLLHGTEIVWDREGRAQSRTSYRYGEPIAASQPAMDTQP